MSNQTTETEAPAHVKLRIPGENFWAIPVDIEKGIFKVDNLLVSDDYRYRDIVRADRNGNVLELIERTCEQWPFTYDMPSADKHEEFREVWNGWNETLSAIDVELEGMFAGSCMAAFPAAWTREQAIEKITGAVPELKPYVA